MNTNITTTYSDRNYTFTSAPVLNENGQHQRGIDSRYFLYNYMLSTEGGEVEKMEGTPFAVKRGAQEDGIVISTAEEARNHEEFVRNVTRQAERDEIRSAIIEYMKDGGADRSDIDSLLAHLNMDPVVTKWKVTVHYSYDNTMSFVVEDEDFEDEHEVRQHVLDNLEAEVAITIRYTGDNSDEMYIDSEDTDWVTDEIDIDVEAYED